ncbi:MAG: hypothetical protein PUE30_01150 [Spirochaetia bacterium]|nr:hypothetical protein [Spirochaetia bacterium]
MKKFLRIAAALMAVFAMTNFIACSSGSDSDDSGTGGTETGSESGGSGTGGTETGGGNGGSETGGTETGGNTGNENGGDTGGSSGNTGDSFENTCWVLDDEVWYTDGNCTITVSANSYVHIKDGSNGDVYFSNGVSNAVTELLKAPAAAGSKTVTLEKGYSFTYVIEGTTVKFTFATEQGTGTKEAVLNEDKTSFTITETEIVDGEEETITMTYKKVASAPANATVTLTLKTTEPTTKVLAVEYDLINGLPANFPTADTVVSADWAAPTAAPAENDVTWTWLATTNRKVKSNTGLQVSNGTSAENMITLSADDNFTVTLTYKFAGTYASDKIRCLTINGESVVSMTDTTDNSKTYTYKTTAAKSVTIGANGMKLTKIETAPAE